MTSIKEIAPDVYRISTFLPEGNIQMNQFLITDDEPLLWHTGQKYLFNTVRDAVAKLIDIGRLKWIGFSHFEPDECGSLNEWLSVSPAATPFCSLVGSQIMMRDYSSRPARGLKHGERIPTGNYQFVFQSTPHLPHGWDAGVLFEEKGKTLFCSDVMHQNGDTVALTSSDIVESAKGSLADIQSGPLTNYIPFTTNTEAQLRGLAALEPKTLAIMHGSSFNGDCAQALLDFAKVLKGILTP